jgi:hypothetical protein
MPRSVAIVFEPDYSAHLERLAFRTPVWLVDTPENHVAAEEVWRKAVDWPHLVVTLFRPPVAAPTRDDWRMLLAEIALNEKSFEALETFGAPLTPVARAAMVEGGFARFDESPTGFRARRS